MEFFWDPVLPEQPVSLFRSGRPAPLTPVVLTGDAVGTEAVLKSRRFSQKELNLALFAAVISRYDNSDVINLLVQAGADVNARADYGVTALMFAKPCNLQPLLEVGADLSARDKWGKDALQHARQVKDATAIRILEEASAQKPSTR